MKGADGFVIVMQRINDSPKRLEEISVPQKSIWRLWGVSVMFAGSRWNWVLSSAAPDPLEGLAGHDRFRTLENTWKQDTVAFQYVSR